MSNDNQGDYSDQQNSGIITGKATDASTRANMYFEFITIICILNTELLPSMLLRLFRGGVKWIRNKVVLEKKSQETSALKGERKAAHGIPFLQDSEEVSRQFEWLKERATLIATPEVAHATAERSRRENSKVETLKSLKQAIEKLKAAREEIHKAYLNAMKLNSAGDDITDEFMASMADLANYTIDEFYAKQASTIPRKNNIQPFLRIQTSDGEIHYFPKEFNINETSANIKDFEKIKAKKTMKKEANEPLFLMRED